MHIRNKNIPHKSNKLPRKALDIFPIPSEISKFLPVRDRLNFMCASMETRRAIAPHHIQQTIDTGSIEDKRRLARAPVNLSGPQIDLLIDTKGSVVMCNLAQYQKLSEPQIDLLIDTNDRDLQAIIANRQVLSDQQVAAFIKIGEERFGFTLVENPNLTRPQIDLLINTNNQLLQLMIAYDERLSKPQIERLIDTNDPEVIRILAEYQKLSEPQIDLLIDTNDPGVIIYNLARYQELSKPQIERLIDTNDPEVIYNLAGNPNLTDLQDEPPTGPQVPSSSANFVTHEPNHQEIWSNLAQDPNRTNNQRRDVNNHINNAEGCTIL